MRTLTYWEAYKKAMMDHQWLQLMLTDFFDITDSEGKFLVYAAREQKRFRQLCKFHDAVEGRLGGRVEGRWISVGDELPEPRSGRDLLTYHEEGDLFVIMRYGGAGWWYDYDDWTKEPDYWMSLPGRPVVLES
jgi:hypothetical protein